MHIDVEVDHEAWGPPDTAIRIIDAAVQATFDTVEDRLAQRHGSIGFHHHDR